MKMCRCSGRQTDEGDVGGVAYASMGSSVCTWPERMDEHLQEQQKAKHTCLFRDKGVTGWESWRLTRNHMPARVHSITERTGAVPCTTKISVTQHQRVQQC